jgi:hypothetical protein
MYQARQFAPCRDPALLAYLAMRNVSPSFLVEIDQFLQSHPEIATFPRGQAMIVGTCRYDLGCFCSLLKQHVQWTGMYEFTDRALNV